MKYSIPQSLKVEHEELHKKLKEAIFLPGQTGEAAKAVAELLHPHFVKEEKYALPCLGLLPLITSGQLPDDTNAVIEQLDQFRKELPQMLEEHQQIVAALQKLRIAAKEEQHPGVTDFAEKLQLHAQTEEEVIYPTALLIADYLKLKQQSEPVKEEYYP